MIQFVGYHYFAQHSHRKAAQMMRNLHAEIIRTVQKLLPARGGGDLPEATDISSLHRGEVGGERAYPREFADNWGPSLASEREQSV
jgi:hypothetical protein